MKIAVGCLTWNVYATGRRDLLLATLESITREPYPHDLTLLTNGSTDATDMLVSEFGGIVDNTHPKMWYGMQQCIERSLAYQPDIVVFTADDIVYHPGWMARLAAFWQAAPDDVKLASLFIEDGWPWNTVREAFDYGGVRGLIRDSAPGASWSFRARDAGLILPIPQQSPGEDHLVNQRIKDAGYRMAQLDLATHAGIEVSAWGNASHLRADTVPSAQIKQEWGLA